MMLLPPLSAMNTPAELKKAGFSWRHRLVSECRGKIIDTFEKNKVWQLVVRNGKNKNQTVMFIFQCNLKQMQNYIEQVDKISQLSIEHL